MCGVVAGAGYGPAASLAPAVAALAHRGPDAAGLLQVGRVTLGHRRLAILDLDTRSDQPFRYGPVALSYNGELWNYRQLRAQLQQAGHPFATSGDTEVVAAALQAWGPGALPRLEGMFAMAWTDDGGRRLQLARDRFGEVPLHYAPTTGGGWLAASERKALRTLGVRGAADVPPGCHLTLDAGAGGPGRLARWYWPPTRPAALTLAEAAARLRKLLGEGVAARSISDVPVCTLLSGGIDSAAVAHGLVAELGPGRVVAYTAVHDPRSRDLRCARLVAERLGIGLVEVAVPVPTPDQLARVVRTIELDSKAQVEIGWPCLRLAEAITGDGFKVTFSGEGSDELWASYGFAYHALRTADWHHYRRDLFLTQARRNFPRANKAFAAYGVECRLPFLQTDLVEFALSLPRAAVQDGPRRPKAVLQTAYADALPAEITGRPKVAFQDGLGIKTAIGGVLADPARFYRAELRRAYG